MIDLKDRLLIITANLVAMFMAYYYQSIALILLLYWIENAIIGVFNILRMASCGQNPVGKLLFIPFFFMHYGIFMVAHFIFLVFLLGWIGEGNVMNFSGIATIIIGVIAMIITHGMRFIIEETAGALKNRSPHEFIFNPYPRIIVMHLTIILGSLMYFGLDKPFYIIFLMIALKTLIELYMENIQIWNPTVRRI